MPPNFKCSFCDKRFGRHFSLKRHVRLVHNITLKKENDVKGTFCCTICKETLNKYSDFFKHSFDIHNIQIKTEKLQFNTVDEFLIWKTNEEQKSKTSFVKKIADRKKVLGNICKTSNFNCNRSGFYHPKPNKDERKREIKGQGSRKINGFCPCRMTVKYFNDGKVSVEYCSTHIGHKIELAHLPLTREDRQNIATKMSSQVPFDVILENVHSSVSTEDLDRIHLLTKQDLYNIKAEFGLNDDTVSHSNDATSLNAWVEEEKQKGKDTEMGLAPLKARLIENFVKTINKMTSKEEVRLGEQSLKVLEKKLKSIERCRPTIELPNVQPMGNKNIQPQMRFLSLNKRKKSTTQFSKRPTKEEKQQISMDAFLQSPLSPDSVLQAHIHSRYKDIA